jgi:transposase
MAAQLDLFDPSIVYPAPKRRSRRRNELLEIMQLTLVVARRQLSDYACPKSKHTFTQPQLLACLVLRSLRKLTYRGTTELLEASDGLRAVLGLDRVPAHTTLIEFAKKLSPVTLDGLVGQVLLVLQEKGLVVQEVAIDSTGVETRAASTHYLSRSKGKRGGYIKLALAVACSSIVLISATANAGPCNDLAEAPHLLWRSATRCSPDWLVADRGYDAEKIHRFCRAWDVISYVPPVPKTKDGTIQSGEGRIRCGHHRPYLYGRRWHVESFISGLKRTCGWTLSARSQPSLKTEAMLKALAYALRR